MSGLVGWWVGWGGALSCIITDDLDQCLMPLYLAFEAITMPNNGCTLTIFGNTVLTLAHVMFSWSTITHCAPPGSFMFSVT